MKARNLLCLTAAVLGAAGLSALYLGLRRGLTDPLPLAEAAAVVALLLAATAALAVVLTRRHYGRTLRELGERLAEFRAAPSGGPLDELRPEPAAGDEWSPLLGGIDGLAEAYRQALGEVVRTQEALERFRSFAGLVDSEKGESHSFVKGKSAFFR
ncbi:MAG TPA: hypothetical protein VFA26_26095, partial [Gemmataceae bacterium]|nr:hypothetical protein [Gemmataceae bacterium]